MLRRDGRGDHRQDEACRGEETNTGHRAETLLGVESVPPVARLCPGGRGLDHASMPPPRDAHLAAAIDGGEGPFGSATHALRCGQGRTRERPGAGGSTWARPNKSPPGHPEAWSCVQHPLRCRSRAPIASQVTGPPGFPLRRMTARRAIPGSLCCGSAPTLGHSDCTKGHGTCNGRR